MSDQFQTGTLVKRLDARGFTWVLRYTKDGQRKAMKLGTHLELPTEAAARRKASEMVPTINDHRDVHTVGELIEKFKAEQLPHRHQSAASYTSSLKHVEARWGDVPMVEMLKNLVAIETWIGGLKRLPVKKLDKSGTMVLVTSTAPLSKKTKQNIKALMHRLIECAMKWGYLDIGRNPMQLIDIKAKGLQPIKRKKVPIARAEYFKLIDDPLTLPHVRTMVIVAVCLGLRVSEILGLKWDDVDFDGAILNIERSAVGAHIDGTKSDESETTLPLHPHLLETLRAWKKQSTSVNGWVFESATTGRPFHRDSLQTDHLKPAGSRVGIEGLGWHTFRHSHIAFLRQVGVASEVQMMLMRHANMQTTNEYGRDGGSMEIKRVGNSAVVDSILSRE